MTESASAAAGTVEILTIHKAKGLEWDHVFLIGADRPVRGDARALAQWRFVAADSSHATSNRAVLIAARDSRRRAEGSVFDFVSEQTRGARDDEGKRLLYVAATRARRTLTVSRTTGHKAPPPGSFAHMLGVPADDSLAANDAPVSRRLLLEASLKRAALPEPFGLETIVWPAYSATIADADTAVPEEQRDARAQGIVGHLLFEGFAAAHARGQTFAPNAHAVARRLLQEGASVSSVQAYAQRLATWFAAASTLNNIQFLFNATHQQTATEWSLPGDEVDDTALRVDYTFVTAENVRWVIDFKFAEPGPDVDRTAWRAAQAAQYRPQLAAYVTRIRALDATEGGRVVRAALYFPWCDGLEEVVL